MTMEEIIIYIQENLVYAPFIVFGLLLLAGFNLPVSEDALLFACGLLARQNPDKIIPLFLGVYLGAYTSDLICYWLGRSFGPRLWKIGFFRRAIGPQKVEKVRKFYRKNGFLTLLLGRFIPFGVRNALFITAGLFKMNFIKFALFDFVAVTLTCSIYFTLYYTFGNDVITYIKKGNIIIFTIFLMLAVIYFYRKKIRKKPYT